MNLSGMIILVLCMVTKKPILFICILEFAVTIIINETLLKDCTFLIVLTSQRNEF